jgi:Flp pilus assembly protein CpaB
MTKMQNVLNGKLTSTRGGALAIGTIAALIAGVLLVVYLNRYRNSVNNGAEAAPVLIARTLIPQGTPGSVVAQKKLYDLKQIAHSDIKSGAVVDPAYLAGRVATHDIYPGQQITDADISTAVTTALPAQITGRQRAFALNVDDARGLVGFVADGDHVDVYYETGSAGTTALALLAANVTVLRAPTKDTPALFKADAPLAQRLALGVDTGTLWFLLRPSAQVKEAPKKLLTSQQLLALIEAEK